MSHNVAFKPKQEVTTISTLPWKNSLLTKEDPEVFQNPLNYFGNIVQDYDTFSILFEDILKKRDLGELLEYHDKERDVICSLDAFLIVQDVRGVSWICPVFTNSDPIDQKVCILNLNQDTSEDPYRTTDGIGTMVMTLPDFTSACSRGFENASRLLLGDESVKLDVGYRLMAGFCFLTKETK
jgi:hypothetical protein